MIRLALIVLALASPAFAQTAASCLQTPGTVCKTGDTMTGPLALHAAVLTPTGTIAYTSPGNTIVGTSTHFTTELAVGDAISPTTAGGIFFVLAITNDTSMTVNPAPLASWTTQAWTYARPLTVWQNMLGSDRIKFLAGGAAFFNATSPQGYFTYTAPISPSGTLTTIHTTGAAGASGSGSTNGTGGSPGLTIVNGAGGNFTSGTGHQGGAGAGVLFSGGSGGNITATDTAAGNTGGDGGAFTVRGGSGGQVTAGTGNTGGAGAQAALLGGTGGAAIASNTNGNGGAVLVDGGVAGAGAGTAGAVGPINIGTQNKGFTTIGAGLATSGVLTPPGLGTSNDDYNPTGLSTASVLRLTAAVNSTISGIAGGVNGRILVLHNVDPTNSWITLLNETTSTPANQFALSNNADVTIFADMAVTLQYDGTAQRWRMIGSGVSPNDFVYRFGRTGTTNDFTITTDSDGTITGSSTSGRTLSLLSSSASTGSCRTSYQGTNSTGTNLINCGHVQIAPAVGFTTVAPTLELLERGTAGTNFVGFKAPDLAADTVYTLPPAFPTSAQSILASSTGGGMSWVLPTTRLWIPAAGCNGTTPSSNWDLLTGTPATPICVTGTNITKGVLEYPDTAGGFSAQMTIGLPVSWRDATLPDIAISWTTTATSGNIKWVVQLVCTDVAGSTTDDPAFPTVGNDGYNTVTQAAPTGGASRVQTALIAAATLPASCVSATRELLHINLFRDGNDGADTIGADARFISMEFAYRHAA